MNTPSQPGIHEHGASGTLRDPVCGMSVSAESQHRTTHDGETYYFCCAGCLNKFRASPEKYLAGEPGSHPAHEHAQGTPPTGEPSGAYILSLIHI